MSMCLATGKDESTALKQSRPCQRETTQTADSAVSSKERFVEYKKRNKIEATLSYRVSESHTLLCHTLAVDQVWLCTVLMFCEELKMRFLSKC